jgi:hypothetical protein
MSQNCGHRNLATTFNAVQITATQRAAFDSNKDLAAAWDRRWNLSQLDVTGIATEHSGKRR